MEIDVRKAQAGTVSYYSAMAGLNVWSEIDHVQFLRSSLGTALSMVGMPF
jgi:hypothetical protein